MIRRWIRRLLAACGRLPGVRGYRNLQTAASQLQSEVPAIRNMLEQQRSLLASYVLERELAGARYDDPKRLQRHRFQACSQNGEDGIIHEVFKRVGTSSRVFVEIGVGNGTENNTAFLLSQGWTGFWIDGASSFLALANRPDLRGALHYAIARVDRENVSATLRNVGVPEDFDLLSIDVDQNTYFVWEGISGFQPRVVVLEYNAAIPAQVEWTVQYDPSRSWDGTQNFGASLKALELLGRRKGYALVGCEPIGLNAFFVREDVVGSAFAEPFTAENHWEPPRYALVHRSLHAGSVLDRRVEPY